MAGWNLHKYAPDPGSILGSQLLPLLLCTFLLGACASQPFEMHKPAALQGQTIPTVIEPNFSQISPAMLDFLDQFVDQKHGKEQAIWSLVWAATDQNIRSFNYRPELTLPPLQAFDQKTGNCLSFSAMFMMMARHLGLNAWYQEVEIPEQWANENDTLLVSMHVNVVIDSTRSGSSWVVDVSGMDNSRSRLQRRISDNNVLAQYYNNLGANALTAGDLGTAYAYFSKAIETEPRLTYLWSNLGVVYARNEQIQDAQAAYLTALKLDSSSSMAANNLYLIYERTGNLQAAAELFKRVEKHRRKNPYYLTHLSALAYEEGRLDESRELAERAVELQQNEYRFHYQLARTLAREGKHQDAEVSLARALELAPEELLVTMAQLEPLPEQSELP